MHGGKPKRIQVCVVHGMGWYIDFAAAGRDHRPLNNINPQEQKEDRMCDSACVLLCMQCVGRCSARAQLFL